LLGTNTLAYSSLARVKSFIIILPGVNVIKLFTAVIYKLTNKLECLHPLQAFPGFVGKAGAYPSEMLYR
jgi:hypothetical protein